MTSAARAPDGECRKHKLLIKKNSFEIEWCRKLHTSVGEALYLQGNICTPDDNTTAKAPLLINNESVRLGNPLAQTGVQC